MSHAALRALAERWADAEPAERANSQIYLTELCEALEVERPRPGGTGTEFGYGAVAFFDLQDGLKLALWPHTSIARDTGVGAAEPSPTELALGHNVASREEVDRVMATAKRAGARIVKETDAF